MQSLMRNGPSQVNSCPTVGPLRVPAGGNGFGCDSASQSSSRSDGHGVKVLP